MPHERPAATSAGRDDGVDPTVQAALGRAAGKIVLARLGAFLVIALAILVALEAGCLWIVLGQSKVVIYAPEAAAVRPFEMTGEGP